MTIIYGPDDCCKECGAHRSDPCDPDCTADSNEPQSTTPAPRVDASTAPVPIRSVDGGPHKFQPKEPGSVYCAAPCHYHESMAIHDVPTDGPPPMSDTTRVQSD